VTATRADLLGALGIDLPEDLLTVALTHRSYAYENGGLPTNERLELLGDAVLGLVIVEELFRRHPDSSEGDLAKLRNSIVNSHALAGVARDLTGDGLGEYLLLGRGETNTGGHAKSSILADTVESLIGAVYLQHGLAGAQQVILRLFRGLLDTAPTLGAALEWKSSLQELTVARGLGVPRYEVTTEGPDHERWFSAEVFVNGEVHGRGDGHSKKIAETNAAAQAWTALAALGATLLIYCGTRSAGGVEIFGELLRAILTETEYTPEPGYAPLELTARVVTPTHQFCIVEPSIAIAGM
jgi:ribonuclease-3